MLSLARGDCRQLTTIIVLKQQFLIATQPCLALETLCQTNLSSSGLAKQ